MKSPETIVWEYYRAKAEETLAKIEDLPSFHGIKWKAAMIEHYQGVLAEIDATKPAE